jgi:dolichol kinase
MEIETRRQMVHALGIVFPFYILKVGWKASAATFSFFLFAGYVISSCHKKGMRIPIISRMLDLCERPEMLKKFPGKGALSFFTGSLLVVLLFKSWLSIAAASIIILALGDSTSTLIGKKFGKRLLFYNKKKSLEGSIAGFVIAFFGASFIVPPLVAMIGALVGTVTESLPLKIDDNIAIPLTSSLAMLLA